MTSVSVVGLGKLGACLAACAAAKGMTVVGVDVMPDAVAAINSGRAPVVEPGLDDLIVRHRSRLRATDQFEGAVQATDVTFIVVPTPSDQRGAFSLRFVAEATRQIGRALAVKPGYHLVVLTSTVLPGSMGSVVQPILEESSGKRCGVDFGLCYNPEFIALGSVIPDLLRPDMVLIGESDSDAGRRLQEWYRGFCENTPPIARMNFVNAELAKIAVNTFLTMKITFANMLANICERLPGGDVDVVTGALGLDGRIGGRYLKGGLGFGGPCFPRDNAALAFLADELGSAAPLAQQTDRANRLIAGRLASKVRACVGPDATVAVLGLAYKPDTIIVEESQGLLLAEELARTNRVTVFDPLALDAARRVLDNRVTYVQSMLEAVAGADVVVVCNPCREFKTLRRTDLPNRPRPIVVFDCWRLWRTELADCAWVHYMPLGVGPAAGGASRQFQALYEPASSLLE